MRDVPPAPGLNPAAVTDDHIRTALAASTGKFETFTGKDGKRGDHLVSIEIDVPANDAALQQFAEGWDGGGNPRASLGV